MQSAEADQYCCAISHTLAAGAATATAVAVLQQLTQTVLPPQQQLCNNGRCWNALATASMHNVHALLGVHSNTKQRL
jgi:hypothetical protein